MCLFTVNYVNKSLTFIKGNGYTYNSALKSKSNFIVMKKTSNFNENQFITHIVIKLSTPKTTDINNFKILKSKFIATSISTIIL